MAMQTSSCFINSMKGAICATAFTTFSFFDRRLPVTFEPIPLAQDYYNSLSH